MEFGAVHTTQRSAPGQAFCRRQYKQYKQYKQYDKTGQRRQGSLVSRFYLACLR